MSKNVLYNRLLRFQVHPGMYDSEYTSGILAHIVFHRDPSKCGLNKNLIFVLEYKNAEVKLNDAV